MEIIFGIIVSVLSLAGAGFFYLILYVGTDGEQSNLVVKRLIFGLMFILTKISLIFILFLVFKKRKEIDLLLFLSTYGVSLLIGIVFALIVYKSKSTKKIAN